MLALADRGDDRAQLAIDVMLHPLVTAIGAVIAAAGGIDALLFTGGIGQRSARVRRATVASLAFLGFAVGLTNEAVSDAEVNISADSPSTATVVIRAREDLELVREARTLLTRQ